jgi:hypothetical protein
VTVNNDASAPQLTTLEMFDIDGNGKVDRVVATFNETLATPYSAPNSVWTLSNAPSGATLNSVSVAGTQATLTLTEGAGTATTAVGSFTLALAANANGIRDATGNQSSFAATAPTDKAPPARLTMSMQDNGPNGKVDRIVLTFSETLAASTATAPWTLANVPSGGTLASIAVAGANVTLNVTEGAGAADTAVGSFTIALAASAVGIRDAAGNQSSFAPTTPTDAARPFPTQLLMQDINGNGKMDRILVTFSETLATPYTAPNSVWTLAGVPSGGTLLSVSIAGAVATLTLSEGGGTANTSSAGATVALAASPVGIRDAAGNQTSFITTAIADGARPVPTVVALIDGQSPGVVDAKKDSFSVTFSEALKVSSLCGAWSNDAANQSLTADNDVVVTITDNGTSDILTVSAASCPTFNLGSINLGANYVASTSTFFGGGTGNRSSISWTPGTRVLLVSLGAQATGTLTAGAQVAATSQYTPSTSITDPSLNAMTATVFSQANTRF